MEIIKYRPLRKNFSIIKKISFTKPKKKQYNYITRALLDEDIERIGRSLGVIFKGVFNFNFNEDINKLMNISLSGEMAFIILHDFHYTAVYINSLDAVEFYDSFGRYPPTIINYIIHYIIKRLKPHYLLKYKINLIRNQRKNNNNCGIYALQFLINRIRNNLSFKEATNYKINEATRITNQKGAILKKFGYI